VGTQSLVDELKEECFNFYRVWLNTTVYNYFRRIRMRLRFLGGILLISFTGCVSLSSLKPLIELGKSCKLKEKALKKETENFLRIKEAIERGELKKGLSKKEFLKDYPIPVVVIPEDNQERWVYKRGESSWFSSDKIYLFFNSEHILQDWQIKNFSLSE